MTKRFMTTRWSLVAAAAGAAADRTPAARAALGELCERYWRPLYAFARQTGMDRDAAGDAVQGFVTSLLDGGSLTAHAERGQFRAYLIGAFRHYAANARRLERTMRRGGDHMREDWFDTDGVERQFVAEQRSDEDPERAFERQWALTVLDVALDTLGKEMESKGRGAVFAALRGSLAGVEVDASSLAADLGLSINALRVQQHRMRTRLGELVRTAVADTIRSSDDVGEVPAADVEREVGLLMEALAH